MPLTCWSSYRSRHLDLVRGASYLGARRLTHTRFTASAGGDPTTEQRTEGTAEKDRRRDLAERGPPVTATIDVALADSAMLLAKAVFGKDGLRSVSYLPMLIDRQYRPEVLHAGDPRFDDMAAYMEWTSEGFDHAFTRQGDEILVTASAAS